MAGMRVRMRVREDLIQLHRNLAEAENLLLLPCGKAQRLGLECGRGACSLPPNALDRLFHPASARKPFNRFGD